MLRVDLFQSLVIARPGSLSTMNFCRHFCCISKWRRSISFPFSISVRRTIVQKLNLVRRLDLLLLIGKVKICNFHKTQNLKHAFYPHVNFRWRYQNKARQHRNTTISLSCRISDNKQALSLLCSLTWLLTTQNKWGSIYKNKIITI